MSIILTKSEVLKMQRNLLKEYFAEDKEQNFYTLMQDMIECMHDDGFFKQIGLEQMMVGSDRERSENTARPQKENNGKTKSYREIIFEDWLPKYISMGMSKNEFFHSTPKILQAYDKAYLLRLEGKG